MITHFADITAQGHNLKFKVDSLDKLNKKDISCRGSSRGVISSFSKSSRKRFIDKLTRIDDDYISQGCSFLTLTYGQLYPDFKTSKKHLDIFVKRLKRKLDCEFSAIWKLELQKRGAPHFHLIIFGYKKLNNGDYPMTKLDFKNMWGDVIGYHYWDFSRDILNPEKPFTRIEMVYSHKHMMSYVAKYITKPIESINEDSRAPGNAGTASGCVESECAGFNNSAYFTVDINDDDNYTNFVGRFWGVINKKNMVFAKVFKIKIQITKELENYVKQLSYSFRCIQDNSFVQGFTFYTEKALYFLKRFEYYAKTLSLDDVFTELQLEIDNINYIKGVA